VSVQALEELRRVAGPVSRETFERLVAFEGLFRKWAARINLSAPSTLSDVWSRHILDSAQLLRLAPAATHWLDLGSGGGFPGLVLAVLLADRQSAHVDLVESNRKKASFLQSTIGQFDLPARVHAVRIENAPVSIRRPDIVTARALAPLKVLLGLSEPWLSTGATALFHKGRDYSAEIEESAHEWRFDLLEHRSMIDQQSVILEIRNLAPSRAEP
jgi:16S rRNA (guanine527-N7)-methyltransferase